MNLLSPDRCSKQDFYPLGANSFDFVEKTDVVANVRARYGTNRPHALSLESLPPLFYLLCGLGVFILGSSFGAVHVYGLDKGPSGPVSVYRPPIEIIGDMDQAERARIGRDLFKGNCVACHQASGLGQAGNVPPLAGSEWVQGDPARLVCILTKGLQGPVQVNGANYNAQMPAYPAIPADKLSYLLTYVRSKWTNKASAVTEEMVMKARTGAAPPASDSYTEAELLKMK